MTEIVYSIFYVCSETGRLRRNWVMFECFIKIRNKYWVQFSHTGVVIVVFSPYHFCFRQWGKINIQPFFRGEVCVCGGGGLICGKATIRHRYIQFNSFRNLTTLLLENIWNQISLHRTLLSSQPLYLCRVTMVTSMHKKCANSRCCHSCSKFEQIPGMTTTSSMQKFNKNKV